MKSNVIEREIDRTVTMQFDYAEVSRYLDLSAYAQQTKRRAAPRLTRRLWCKALPCALLAAAVVLPVSLSFALRGGVNESGGDHGENIGGLEPPFSEGEKPPVGGEEPSVGANDRKYFVGEEAAPLGVITYGGCRFDGETAVLSLCVRTPYSPQTAGIGGLWLVDAAAEEVTLRELSLTAENFGAGRFYLDLSDCEGRFTIDLRYTVSLPNGSDGSQEGATLIFRPAYGVSAEEVRVMTFTVQKEV